MLALLNFEWIWHVPRTTHAAKAFVVAATIGNASAKQPGALKNIARCSSPNIDSLIVFCVFGL